jgi:YfiH family protein
VRVNRKILKVCFGQKPLVLVRQIHGDKAYIIRNESDLPSSPPTADALITNISGINLVIQVADCQAVILFDPVEQVIANVHSGWRGSIQNIVGKTIRQMISEFGSVPENTLAGIGPSLGPCCGEFINYRSEIPRQLWQYRVDETYFDFWAMSRDQLMEEGILPDNISNSKRCTVCNTKDFFSYRAEKTTGRFASVIGLI